VAQIWALIGENKALSLESYGVFQIFRHQANNSKMVFVTWLICMQLSFYGIF
jgi:hypothetical protein